MRLAPAEAIFDLPYPNVKSITPLNDLLAPAVAAALPREEALPKRRVIGTDGFALSQYARVTPLGGASLRTLNVDLLLWFCAGLEAPIDVVLDSRVVRVLSSGGHALTGNFKVVAGDILPNGSAILADRTDLVAFGTAICDDISSDTYNCLIIYDILEVAARLFIDGARKAGLSIEVVPGPHAHAVLRLDNSSSRTTAQQLLRAFVEQIKMAPEYLAPRVRDKRNHDLLNKAFSHLLERTLEACSKVNAALRVPARLPAPPILRNDVLQDAKTMATELCAILDPERNPSAAIGGREYRPRALEIQNSLQAMNPGSAAKAQDLLLQDYELLWRFFHLVSSWSAHSLAQNETFRLALDRKADAVIAPKAFKPFGEYVFFYRAQEFERRRKNIGGPACAANRSLLGGSISHVVRKWQVIGLIEMLFTLLRRERPNETLRWLDLGCGSGDAINCVRIEDYLPDENWEIIGVDWNKSNIDQAAREAKSNRTFLLGDVKEAVDHIGGGQFNIVSAFEFVEHLEDPVRTLKSYAPLCNDFFIAGSPLEEQQSWLPAPAHIWSFDRKGYAATLDAAGFTPVFANEAHIGKFLKDRDHDWVTVIGGKNRTFPARIKSEKHVLHKFSRSGLPTSAPREHITVQEK